ncbi:D-ribose pyranase [candidate division KSB1 bacterium]|nr:D-ribose pyranase [candidate division KSB1 bacterium]RQW05970.1 MAG: D-ribose pyranase [candidate division KSB1 bacterium]
MKKNGVLNVKLSTVIARMGHTDRLVICDVGLPIPREADVIDLALAANVPPFFDTLQVILGELHVQNCIIAEEMKTKNDDLYEKVSRLMRGVPIQSCPHAQFKEMTKNGNVIAFVRTGEASPFANIILESGVTF